MSMILDDSRDFGPTSHTIGRVAFGDNNGLAAGNPGVPPVSRIMVKQAGSETTLSAEVEQSYRNLMNEMVNLSIRSRKMTKVSLQKALMDIQNRSHEASMKASEAERALREALQDISAIRKLMDESYASQMNAILNIHKEMSNAQLPQRPETVPPAE